MDKQKIPIFYLYIHSKLAEKYKGRVVTIKDMKGYMAEWRIPIHIRVCMIKEMETMKSIITIIIINFSS